MQAFLGFASETHWLRHARSHLFAAFAYLPRQSGYNKRLRAASDQLSAMIRLLAEDCDCWADGTWVMDSTPTECGRSQETAKRYDLVGWAGYRYRHPQPLLHGGLHLHLVTTLAGFLVIFAITNPKDDERLVTRGPSRG